MTSLSASALSASATCSPPVNHKRKHSRSPSALPLPNFAFNPGAEASSTVSDDGQEATMAAENVPSGHMRRSSKPAALPDFKFNPGADLPNQPSPSPTHPVLEEMALNQQRASRSARPAPLPVFTFNPGSTSTPQSTSPTKSEFGSSDPAKQPFSGHKRAGSEFVGGANDTVQVVSTSPKKLENTPGGPPVTLAGRRGHSHRRSQAISVSDIDTSDLIKAHAKSRAPATPSTPHQVFNMPPTSPAIRHSMSISARSAPNSPLLRESISNARPRVVDFSERVDVIPRPLSMISSETEGSNSTMRGHSVTNSINSIASSHVSPPRKTTMADISTTQAERPRPKTADPTALIAATKLVATTDDQLALPKRPLSASGSPVDLKQSLERPAKKKHFWSSSSHEPSTAVIHLPESPALFTRTDPSCSRPVTELKRPKTAPGHTSSSKRHRYHTWTAGIFSKKSRSRGSKSKPKRAPTPPNVFSKDSDVNEIFDGDDTVVLREDSPVGERRPQPVPANESPYLLEQDLMEDFTSPVLDLDAALDPFGGDDRLAASHHRSAASRIAKLHSSERRGVSDAFGTVHRRTESAPTMPAVNRSFFGIAKHSSNGSLAEDVFDEQEEDNFLADQEKASSDVDLRLKNQNALARHDSRHRTDSATSEGLGLLHMSGQEDAVVIVDTEDELQAEELGTSESTIEAPVEHTLPKRPSTSPMPFVYPMTQSHYASSTEGRTTTASLISSPDPDHLSFDASSRAKRMGEPSPDFRIRPSTDDIPSLSDSVSSGMFPRISSSNMARPSLEQRSNSMFVPRSSHSNDSWKRSSLASLNRLIPGSSHGSKLKFETMPNAPSTEEKSKRKSNRLSKLKFWRSKEEVNQL